MHKNEKFLIGNQHSNIPSFQYSNGNLARSCLAMAGGANRTNLLLWAHAIFVKKARKRFQA